MRFGMLWSRPATAGEEFLKVLGDLGVQLGGAAGVNADNARKNTWQEAAQVTEHESSIDTPPRVRLKALFGGQMDSEAVEVVTHDLVADILAPPARSGRNNARCSADD